MQDDGYQEGSILVDGIQELEDLRVVPAKEDRDQAPIIQDWNEMLPPEKQSTFMKKRDTKMLVKEEDDDTKEIQELILRNPDYESMK